MIVQSFMCLHAQDIVAVQQPVQLLARQRNNLIQCLAGPFELRLFQTLLPQAITVSFPVEDFDLVTLAVAEHEQLFREWIQLKRAFYQDRQTIYPFAEVDHIPAHINHRQVIRRSHSTDAAVLNTVVNVRASTSPANATDTPLGKPIPLLVNRCFHHLHPLETGWARAR